MCIVLFLCLISLLLFISIHTYTHSKEAPFREELVCMMVLVGMAVSVSYCDESMLRHLLSMLD